jgi:hypothetical protein
MDSITLLRHALATLAYRSIRSLHPAPDEFPGFRASLNSRSAGEILAHMGDLLDWSLRHLESDGAWREIPFSSWDAGKERYFGALTRLDQALQRCGEITDDMAQRLFQGPIADALTHVGQLCLMRGLAGVPVKSENYYVADIAIGRTTAIQPPPKRTF